MTPEEIAALIGRLQQPSENGPATDDVAAVIGLIQENTQALSNLRETSEAKVQQLSQTNEAQANEILALKAKNFDLMMLQPGIPASEPEETNKPRGIAGIFERKSS